MAMADSLKVTVRGRQSHGSQPQDAIDPIVLGAHMVVRLQTIVSRELHPMSPAVVTVGTFHGGLKENIIPASAEFTLNIRTLDQDVRDPHTRRGAPHLAAEAAASAAPGAADRGALHLPASATTSRPRPGDLAEVFRTSLGDEAVSIVPPVMGSEDFGHLAAAIGVPSVFWCFGGHPAEVLEGDGPVPVNHSPFFAPVMEPTLSTGVHAAVAALVARLGR